MLNIHIDSDKASAIINNMVNQITELGNMKIPNEMQAWQNEEFNRIKPNMTIGKVGRGTFVSTRFWKRRVRKYVKHWILRPEKKTALFDRMTSLAQKELVWRR